MAATLNAGAESMAAANWSDGVGIAAAAALSVGVKFARIAAGLSYTGVAIESLDFNAGSEGIVGGQDEGPLILDADNVGGTARVRNAGKVDLRIQAGGPNTLIENFHTGHAKARSRLMGGNFGFTSISAGRMTATGASEITTLEIMGGKAKISEGSAAAITTTRLTGGALELNRKSTAIVVGAGSVLDLKPDDGVTWTGASIIVYGGLVRWWGGELPSIEAYGGAIDFRYARQPLGSTLGTTKFDVSGTRIMTTPDINLSNLNPLGAVYRSDSELIEVGGPIPV